MLGFLAARAVAGMETVVDGVYSRSIGLNGFHGTVSVWPGDGDALEVELDFPDPSAVSEIVVRLRRMFDLDADLPTMQRHLAVDPLLARLIAERPGLRVPGRGMVWNWRFARCWGSRSPWSRRFGWRGNWWRSMASLCVLQCPA